MMIQKEARSADGLEFVLSDETVDRYGDVIVAAGWQLANFKRNPIALFGHDQRTPIGVWENLRVEGTKLIGRLKLAARGTSQRIDEIISLVEQGVLKAVSVGFRPLDREPIGEGGGIRYKRQELLETSVVSVPANPAALAVAKSMNISADTMKQVFGEEAETGHAVVTRTAGVTANNRNTPNGKGMTMTTLSKRIEDTQEKLNVLKGDLEAHLEAIGEEPSEDDNLRTKALNEKIVETKETLDNLVEAERSLGLAVVERSVGNAQVEQRKPWAAPAPKVEPVDFIFRALTAKVISHVHNMPLVDAMKGCYGEDVKTKAVMDRVIGIDTPFDHTGFITQKSSVAPADTVTPAWAGALVQTAIGDFFDLLMPDSVYPRLSSLGGRFGFGRNGTISLPTRSATPTVAGSFVAEGAPIPVRKAGFSSVTLTPRKMAVITTMTREITERSVPAIEQLLRSAIQEDTAVSIDSILLDANAATTVRPVGLRNGITTAAGTAGGGFAAVTTDLKGMLTTLVTNTNGNIRQPAFIMNPIQAIALGFVQNAGGDLVFKEEIGNGRLNGYPVIQSGTVPAGVVILIDAADFFSATGDDPRFDVSDQAVLHMEDTSPAQIGTAGAPNVVAAPVQSMFQTDALALRMILPMSWAMRRTGVLVERTAVTW
jgi:HK97 family phage prohead protease/HK97 family phage major capsid protein